MWQTKYALAVPKNLGLGLNFQPCSEGNFLSVVRAYVHTANDPLMSCMKNACPPFPDFTFPSFQFHRRIRVMYSWHLLPSFRAALRRACFKINANEFGTKPLLTPGSCRSFSSLLLQRTYKKLQETSFKLDISN